MIIIIIVVIIEVVIVVVVISVVVCLFVVFNKYKKRRIHNTVNLLTGQADVAPGEQV